MDAKEVMLKNIRKARQTSVKIGKWTFVCRRPTDREMVPISAKKNYQLDLLDQFVVDWKGVTELDLYSSGTDKEVPFDLEVFKEWIADKQELWPELCNVIIETYNNYYKKKLDAAKK